MGLRKQRKQFTIMVIPHSERTVVTFRLPIGVLQVVSCLLAVSWLALLIFVTSYFRTVTAATEISDLRLVNREQRVQIQHLVQETAGLRERLSQITALEQQVRELAQLDESAAWVEEQTRLLRLESAFDTAQVATGSGGGSDSLFVVAGTASRQPLQHAATARAEITAMNLEFELRRGSMEVARVVLTEQQAYLAARPSTWPVQGILTSGFGYRQSPFGRVREFHNGIDIAAPHRTPIATPGVGVVTFAGTKSTYGNTLIVDHGYGFTTLYGHCTRLLVKVGDEVERGDVIAQVGSTGRSTGPHLHYEVRVDGRPVDPRPYLTPPK